MSKEHDANCECGDIENQPAGQCDCGCSDEQMEQCGCGGGEDEFTVTLSLDDGTDLECTILTIFPAGEREYIALLPKQQEDSEEGEVYLYRYSEDEDGQPSIDNIDDDDEYELVADAFDELLDEEDYELIED